MNLENTVLVGLRNHHDASFRESLVYIASRMVDAGETYYTGFIFNRRAAITVVTSVTETYQGINQDDVYYGGEISTHRAAMFLHDHTYEPSDTAGCIQLGTDAPIRITTGLTPWLDMQLDAGPNPYKLVLGYTQWKADELEAQVTGIGEDNGVKTRNPVWVCIDPTAEMILRTDGDWLSKWEEAIRIYSRDEAKRLINI